MDIWLKLWLRDVLWMGFRLVLVWYLDGVGQIWMGFGSMFGLFLNGFLMFQERFGMYGSWMFDGF